MRKCKCIYASELRKFWHFYILKLLFLSIFCRYISYFVGTNDILVGLNVPTNFQMYRQKSQKVLLGGGGNCPPPPSGYANDVGQGVLGGWVFRLLLLCFTCQREVGDVRGYLRPVYYRPYKLYGKFGGKKTLRKGGVCVPPPPLPASTATRPAFKCKTVKHYCVGLRHCKLPGAVADLGGETGAPP